MSIEMRNRIKVLEDRVAKLEAAQTGEPVDFSDILTRLAALESRPKRGRPPKHG